MRRRRSSPPLAILMDLLMLLMVMMILTSEKDVYQITFSDRRVPDGSRLAFRATDGGRLVTDGSAWRAPDAGVMQGAVYVSCPFCADMRAPAGADGVFEVALLGATAQSLRDIVFDQCAARQKCRPLRVSVGGGGAVELLINGD